LYGPRYTIARIRFLSRPGPVGADRLQYRFVLPGTGHVLTVAGRLVVGPDWAHLSFSGLERVDMDALCAALAP
jgi:hypothetical protein